MANSGRLLPTAAAEAMLTKTADGYSPVLLLEWDDTHVSSELEEPLCREADLESLEQTIECDSINLPRPVPLLGWSDSPSDAPAPGIVHGNGDVAALSPESPDPPDPPDPPESMSARIRMDDHWQDLLSFIGEVGNSDPVDLKELAHRYLRIPHDLSFGRPQDQNELMILVVDHFAAELDRRGWGAQVMKGCPHLYNGYCWGPIPEPDMTTALGDFAEAMGIQPVTARNHQFRARLIKQFKSLCRCGPAAPNRDRVVINLSGGTLEIVGCEETMRGFHKDDLFTYRLPFAFDRDAGCPLFDRFLERVLPDQASREVLAEFFGWTFIRDLKLEVALMLFGDGHNGKSVVFDVIRALLGEQNVTTIGLSLLSKMENRFPLGSALLNFASEFDGRCDSGIFKKMVSGEPLEARRLYSDQFIMQDYARLAFNVNTLPRDVEHTCGFRRRFLIIPFRETISRAERDPNLARRIIATELPGVFNWVLRGMRRLRANQRFTECAASEEALRTFIDESDTVVMFLEEENLGPSKSQRIAKHDLYQMYRSYCRSSGVTPLAKNAFGSGLGRRSIAETKSGGTRYWLIESTPPAEE